VSVLCILDQFGGATYVSIGIPEDDSLGVPILVGNETVYRLCLVLSA